MRVALLGVLAVTVCLLKAAVGVPEDDGENEERLVEEMLEDSIYAELSDQEDEVESENSFGEDMDDTLVTAEDDVELEDIQEEGIFDSQSLIIINQCGSYGKTFADRIKSLSSYMSEITVDCGNCTTIALKGNINANIEFCAGATSKLIIFNMSCYCYSTHVQAYVYVFLNHFIIMSFFLAPCLKSSSLVLPNCKPSKLARRIQSVPFQLPVGNSVVNGKLKFNLPYLALSQRLCYSLKVAAARVPSKRKYGQFLYSIRRPRFTTC